MSAVDFFIELGNLKRLPRTGWLNAGIANPESIADHSFRTLPIAWYIAGKEGADAERVIKLMLVHDLAESRIGDMTLITSAYVDKKSAEKKAFHDMIKDLPDGMRKELSELFSELGSQSREAVVAKDADKVEMYLQAHEYAGMGYSKEILQEWKDSAEKKIRTKTARALIRQIDKSRIKDWWKEFV